MAHREKEEQGIALFFFFLLSLGYWQQPNGYGLRLR